MSRAAPSSAAGRSIVSGEPAGAGSAHDHRPRGNAVRFSRRYAWVLACVFLTFVASSAVRRPAPSVNEPHYLAKARHYWNPAWCAGDLFLESSNPHRVFYQTVGALTLWMTLFQTAWTGRILALACLAWGWTRMLSLLLPERWHPLGAAWVFLLLQSLGDFSGEWLVGGVEAKVFSYGFVFAALASGVERRWIPAGLWLGAAISVHVIVGLWTVAAVVLGTTGRLIADSRASHQSDPRHQFIKRLGVDWKRPALGGLAMLLVALPGLLPAINLLGGIDPAAAAEADRLQVGVRLAHHLDPMRFPLSDYRYYALLLVITGLLWQRSAPSDARRWFACFVAATLVIAAAGVLIGWGPRPLSTMPFSTTRVWLLKFYPFRLADLFVPILASTTAIAALHATGGWFTPGWKRRWTAPALAAIAYLTSLGLPTPDRNPSRMTEAKRADWLDLCRWIREETPADTILYAANEDWAVKWFAERPEFVNYKDCPQDAEGIIEWARRLRLVNRWAREAFEDGRCSPEDLARLHFESGITHLTASRLGPIDIEPAYENGHFRVYAIAAH